MASINFKEPSICNAEICLEMEKEISNRSQELLTIVRIVLVITTILTASHHHKAVTECSQRNGNVFLLDWDMSLDAR